MKRLHELEKFMKRYSITPLKMSELSQIPPQSIRGYLQGDYEITDFKWRMLKSAIDKYQHQPKMISVIPEYIIQCLTDFDNTIVMKKKIKGKEKEFAKDLKKLGFKVRLYDTGEDHFVIENKERFPNKPTLLKGCKVIIG